MKNFYRILKSLAFTVCLTGIIQSASGQISSSPRSERFHPELEKFRYSKGNFSFYQPLFIEQSKLDSIRDSGGDLWAERWRKGHLLRKKGEEFSIGVSPLFDLTYYHSIKPDSSQQTNYVNGRGVFVEGTLGNKAHFHTWLMENQAFFPGYLNEFVDKYDVVPGYGRVKPFKDGGADYAVAGGMVSYTPFNEDFLLNFQAGHGKQFFGDGKRSFMVSDAGFLYPMLKATVGKKQWRYQSTLSILQTLERTPKGNTPEAIFYRKNGSFHSLSFLFNRNIELSLFEGIIWQLYDSTERTPLPLNYYLPVMFANTIAYGLDGQNNSVIGLNARVSVKENYIFYGQFVLDDLNSSRWAGQTGIRVLSLPFLKGLMARAEINHAKPFTFAHRNPRQSFTHYNQPLGHILGSGFTEFNGELRWNYKDLFIGVEGFLVRKTDTIGGLNFGTDPLLSLESSLPSGTTVEPVNFKLLNGHGYIAYRINRTYDLVISAGTRLRNDSRSAEEMFVYLKLSTALINRNEDF